MAAVEHLARSPAATELLYRRHAQRVLRYCLGCLRRPADAEDALQQTFLQAHRALERGEQPVSEVAWLLAIARNVCRTRADAHRRRSRREIAADPGTLDDLASTADADEALSAEVKLAFARLSDRQRQALFLREWHGSSYAEIAHALGTSESAVETLIFRARRALAEELGPRRRRLPVVGTLSWLRTLLGSTAAKVAVGAATASVAVGTAVTLDMQRPPARTPPQPAAPASPARVVPARHAAPSAGRPGRAHARVASAPAATPAPAAAARPAAAPTPRRDVAPTARAAEPTPAAETPTLTPTPPHPATATATATPAPAATTPPPTVGSPITGSAATAPSLTQTAGDTVTAATGVVSQTVGGVAQAVGDAAPAAAPVTGAVSQAVDGAAQTTAAAVDQAAAAAQDATSTVAGSVTGLLTGP